MGGGERASGRRTGGWLRLLCLLAPATAQGSAAGGEGTPGPRGGPESVHIGLIVDAAAGAGAAAAALSGWTQVADELRQRTSVAMGLPLQLHSWQDSQLWQTPLVVWRPAADPAAADADSGADSRRAWLSAGGHLWVDPGPEVAAAWRAAGAMGRHPLVTVAAEHVLAKSFFLLAATGHGGAMAGLRGVTFDQRLAIVLPATSIGASLAGPPAGASPPSGARRLATNWVMMALCLDYKDDQVHVPFILERRH